MPGLWWFGEITISTHKVDYKNVEETMVCDEHIIKNIGTVARDRNIKTGTIIYGYLSQCEKCKEVFLD